jgi:hypothetical protein
MIIIFCDSILSLLWWLVKRILWPLGVLPRTRTRRWPAPRPSTGWSSETIKKRVTIRSAPATRRSRTPFCARELFVQAHQEVVIDLDASDDPLHGQQEGRFFHGYYGCYCYLPLFAFVGSVPLWPSCAPATGMQPEGRSRHSRKSFRRSVKRCLLEP